MTEADRLHTRFLDEADTEGLSAERCYTLTHSDRTGDLFLSIGSHYDDDALRSLQVRLERDEVLARWARTDGGWTLELHMMAQGGLPLFGTGAMRCSIFRHYRPLVLRAICRGDREFLDAHEERGEAPVIACFHWRRGRTECESWGRLADWR